MSSIKNQKIGGDASVGRNVAMGGNGRIAGSLIIGHNLQVKGWLEAPNIKDTNKGVFATVEKLTSAYPSPRDGWFAGVGTSTPFDLYVAEGGRWVATSGELDVEVDLDYYNGEIDRIDGNINNLTDDVSANSDAIEEHNGLIAGHTQQITELTETLTEVQQTATAAKEQSESNAGDISEHGQRIAELSSTVSANSQSIAGHAQQIEQISGTLAETRGTADEAKYQSNANAVNISRVNALVGYYECSTAPSVSAKTISANSFSRIVGGCMHVKMHFANTASSVTLNINGTGAIALYYNGKHVSARNTWEDDEIVVVFFDGDEYQAFPVGAKYIEQQSQPQPSQPADFPELDELEERVGSLERAAGQHNVLPFDGTLSFQSVTPSDTLYEHTIQPREAFEYSICLISVLGSVRFCLKVGNNYYNNWSIKKQFSSDGLIPVGQGSIDDPYSVPTGTYTEEISNNDWYSGELHNKVFYNRSNKVVYAYNCETKSLEAMTNIQVVEENAPEAESTSNPNNSTKGSIVVDLEHDKMLTWDGNKWKEIGGGSSVDIADLPNTLAVENGVLYLRNTKEGVTTDVSHVQLPVPEDGADGQDGKSAYELALEKDSTIGTEEEWLASLNGTDGKSAYELWLEEPNNAGKSIDAFWAYLTADKGYTKQVLTYAEFSALSPQTADTDTIYVYPNANNTEYYNVISNGTSWVNLITKDGEIADYAKIKAALLKSSSSSVERRANLEIGGINGNLNSNTVSTGAIRSANSFLITNSNVTVGVHSNSGNYYPKVAQYNGCDANEQPAAIKSNSDAKSSTEQSLTNANVGSYLRFIIYVYSDSAYQTRIETITEEILNDIYVSSTDSQGVVFDTSNSTSNETSDDEFYNVADIAEEVALNKSKIERIESGENDKVPSTESENRTITSNTDGSFNADGTIAGNQPGYNRGVSDYIDVSGYVSITVVSGIGGSGAAKVGAILYDENKNIIDDGIIIGTNSDGSLSSGTVIDVSTAKYIRFGLSDASVNGSATAIVATTVKDIVSDIVNANVIERIEDIEDSIADVPSDTPNRISVVTKEGGYLNNDGTVHVNTIAERGVSDYISIDKIWKIVTVENIYAAGGGIRPFICLYDEHKTALTVPDSCKANGDANGMTILTAGFPANAKWMRISLADNTVSGTIDVYRNVSISERLNELAELAGEVPSVESRFLVIGSSSVMRMEDTDIVDNDYKLHTLLGIDSSRIVMSGVGGEDIKAITARLGSEMITNSREFTIPADTSEVDLGLKDTAFNVRGSSVSFNTQAVQDGLNMPKLNPIYIDGIKCSIRSTNDATLADRHYLLKRDEAGEEAHTVVAGTQIFPENIYRRDYVLITALGYNGGYWGATSDETLANYLDYHDKALMFCESRRFIFMGRLYGTDWGATSDMLAEEAAMELRYGYNYFNVRKFLVEHGVEYARKLSLYDESNATQDAEDMANGKIPTSLHGGPNDVHLTNDGYKIVNYRLAEIIKYFGWDVKGNYAGGSTSPSNSTPVTPSGEGDANVIEVVKVNGTALTVTDKTVDIPVPAVPSWALAPNKPSYNASEVGALPASTTIPAKASSMTESNNTDFITPALALGAFDRKMQIINAATYVDDNSNLAVVRILNSYCLLTVAQNDTVTLVLPDITNAQQLTMNAVGCVINATIGTGGDIALASAAQSYTVYENGFSDMEAGNMYEINILCIGNNTWAVTAIELKTYITQNSNATPLDNNSGNAETPGVEPENTESV